MDELDLRYPEVNEKDGPVTCLGRMFENDEERRAYFRERLREYLPELRDMPGFPIGTEENILALSDPPYYTACPNPFIPEIVAEWETQRPPINAPYHREPYAADVSEGKNDPIYNAHSYHTKVPHKAIMRYVLHYTNPGDIVFDGFAGTGMTGVAAQLCGDRAVVESLGYKVESDGTILQYDEGKWLPFSKLGARRAILNDLSPAASFIAYNYNTPVDATKFKREADRILEEVEQECGWMYQTLHNPTADDLSSALDLVKTDPHRLAQHKDLPWGRINYTVWSDVFVCPHCAQELVFWEAAVDKDAGKVKDAFPCPHCGAVVTKKKLDRAWTTFYDDAIQETVRHAKQVPVLINYSVGKARKEKSPDALDLALLEAINHEPIPYWFPTDRMPEGDESRRNDAIGITHVHQFYTKRNLSILSSLFFTTSSNRVILGSVKSSLSYAMKMIKVNLARLRDDKGLFALGSVSNTLYIPSISAERPISQALPGKISAALRGRSARLSLDYFVIDTGSATAKGKTMGTNSVDYLFIDPPFGANIMYSELNFLWEAWLKAFTNNKPEAIVNKVQGKGLPEYQQLMADSFREAFRVLKPGRWMTVEFSNTQTSIWSAIQQAIQQAGFVIANVAALDKQQGSFKAVTTTTAVKKDLVISAYKPSESMIHQVAEGVGQEAGIWVFVDEHLRQLPVFIGKKGQAEPIDERTPRSIYDRFVAYYVAHGWPLPITNSADFQQLLMERYPVRDGMIFLDDQVLEYNQKRILVKEFVQTELFVSNESTAIDWIRQQLMTKPQTYSDVQPGFMQTIQHIEKYEQLPELRDLLEDNFLQYDGGSVMPERVLSYLRANYPKYRGDTVTDEMRQKMKECWYVPDANRLADIEKIRQKKLWKEFEAYLDASRKSAKRLKTFRSEVVKAGFQKLWTDKDYATIVLVGDHLPPTAVEDDLFLSQFVMNARGMVE
ncbi:MAG: site-specific DNA-methyltransferase [Firmicutes bacterium]|nr:site-specific DNA-methyltransferase [Bacillota bacterium]